MGCCQTLSDNLDHNVATTDKFENSILSHNTSKRIFKEFGVPYSSIHIKLDASPSEHVFPLWVEPNTEIKFHVRGKWQVFEDQEEVGPIGHKHVQVKVDGFNVGALIGQVLGSNYFNIVDNFTYHSKEKGPIVLFQNTGTINTQPKGFLNVFIEGCKKKPIEEIERLVGWTDVNYFNTTVGHHYLSQEERKMIIIINKVRTNPSLFAKLYLKPKIVRGEAYKECYDDINSLYPRRPLVPDRNLYNVALSHATDMGNNGLTGHFSSKGEDLKTRMLNQNLEPEMLGENSSYGMKFIFTF